jgi:Family of unknown function (DUF6307)
VLTQKIETPSRNGRRNSLKRRSVGDVEASSFRSANTLDRLGKNIMIPGTTLPTPYENRLKLVQGTMTMYSALDDDTAGKLAVHVLHALDSIPEKIR